MMRPPRAIQPTLLALLLCAATLAQAEMRTWTDDQGRRVEARFGGLEDGLVTLLMPSGQSVPFPLEKLSAEDQAFAKAQPAPSAAPEPVSPRLPAEKRIWPDKIDVPTRTLERLQLVAEELENRRYVYQTSAFEFVAQDKLAGSVMTELARTFEATRLLIQALPWGIECRPPPPLERFQAAFYVTRQDYINNGGPANSGGVYDSGDMIFKIPFSSLGLVQRGKTWFKDSGYSNDTLIHEITHQMMHDYLPFLPKWVIEGTAEYTELLPFSSGTFRVSGHKSGIKDYFAAMERIGVSPDLGSVGAHLRMTREGWDRSQTASTLGQVTLYFRSAALVYYFNHLDGDGKGARFIRFFDRAYDEVAAMREFFANPAVKRMPGGRFTYPSNLQPPDLDSATAPFKHIDTLLDGRDTAALAAEIVAGYRSIGIKISATE
jgi:hypothetical protein